MKSVKVLATALLVVSLASAVSAQNNCGNAAAPPKITASTLAAGPNVLDMQGIQYVAADHVQLQVTTDGCTDIQSIQIASITLTPAMDHSGTLPNYYWYSEVDAQNNTNARSYLISVGFPTVTDGSTDEVTLTIVRTGGTGTATYAVPVVHVARVLPLRTDAAIGISGTEIHNHIANALHAKFSGPNNSAVMSGTTVDYEPSSLGTYIDSTGIWLSFRLKAEATCKPIISVTGTFVIVTNAPDNVGLSVRWVNPATATLEQTWCTVVGSALKDIAHYVTIGLVGEAGSPGPVQDELTKDIMNSLPDTSGVNLLLDGSTTQNNQLLINLQIPAQAIEINVPYSAFDVARTPTRFPPGQLIGLIANGLGMNDYVAGASPPATLYSGPNGVPLHTPTTLSNAFTVSRSGTLVDSTASIGQLLVEFPSHSIVVTSGTSDFKYTPGCSLKVPGVRPIGSSPTLLFGVNDTTADAQRLRSYDALGYHVRVIFGFAGSPCAETSRSVVNRPTE
ncbi:MAG: hypothetical protein WB987_08475 [Candidatus Acidiferrales bacterium]